MTNLCIVNFVNQQIRISHGYAKNRTLQAEKPH